MGAASDYTGTLRERIPEAEVSVEPGIDVEILVVDAPHVVDVLRHLKDEHGFVMCTDVNAVDWLPREPRFDVNYSLIAIDRMERLRVKVRVGDGTAIPSATSVWAGADWHEREVYDMFGIEFAGHPDLRRILMPDEWIGHPLRKDYPVGGVPVEYRVEPAYVGENVVPEQARPAAGGVPVRLRRDRGRLSPWTWTGAPASGVRKENPDIAEPSEEGTES